MIKTMFKGLRIRIVTMALLLAVCCFLTYYFLKVLGISGVFPHFFYVPIVLASFWWRRKGIFIAISLSGLLVLVQYLTRTDGILPSVYIRVAVFIGIAFIVATLTEHAKKFREKLEHLNLNLRAIRNVNQIVVREKNRERLLKDACDSLVETRGYYNAWIALLDESGVLLANAESGLGEDFRQ